MVDPVEMGCSSCGELVALPTYSKRFEDLCSPVYTVSCTIMLLCNTLDLRVEMDSGDK